MLWTMADYSLSPPSIDTAPISQRALSVTPNLLTADQVNELRADANALYLSGAFLPGGLRRRRFSSSKKKNTKNNKTDIDMKTTTDDATRVCDICGIFDDAEKEHVKHLGNRDARDQLMDLMSDLRELLQKELSIKLSESMELQYLRYPGISMSSINCNNGGDTKKKGFYGRHFDSTSDDDTTCKRKFSLLLYLNEDGWDAEKDGGVLRAYIQPKNKSNGGAGATRNMCTQ
ncbi:hypothetical protein ACHAXR_001727, partial [Thalassiosira sp. AJA248-18]